VDEIAFLEAVDVVVHAGKPGLLQHVVERGQRGKPSAIWSPAVLKTP